MLNQIVLVGRLTKTPEIIENLDGSKFTLVNLAIPRNFKNEQGEYDIDYVDCALTGKVAENTCEYCKKGDLVGVKGRIQNLNDTASLQVIAEKITFLASKEK